MHRQDATRRPARLGRGEQSGQREWPDSGRWRGAGPPGLRGQSRALGFAERGKTQRPGVLCGVHGSRRAGRRARCREQRLSRHPRRELASDPSMETPRSGQGRDTFRRVTNNICC